MAKMNKEFDAKNVDPSDLYEVLPAGWYKAQIAKSEMKKTKAGDGAYLSLQFKVIDGKSKGRVVFTNLNLDNPNPVAVEIAERNFSQLCHAAKVLVIHDTDQLHGIPLEIKLSVKPAEGNYDARNEVKGYRAIDGETPNFAEDDKEEPTSEAQQAPAADDDSLPDWLKE